MLAEVSFVVTLVGFTRFAPPEKAEGFNWSAEPMSQLNSTVTAPFAKLRTKICDDPHLQCSCRSAFNLRRGVPFLLDRSESLRYGLTDSGVKSRSGAYPLGSRCIRYNRSVSRRKFLVSIPRFVVFLSTGIN